PPEAAPRPTRRRGLQYKTVPDATWVPSSVGKKVSSPPCYVRMASREALVRLPSALAAPSDQRQPCLRVACSGPSGPEPMSRRRSITRWLLLFALGLTAFYLVGANLLLASGALPRLIGTHSGALALEWRSAWTLLPGRVHVRDFRLRAASGARAQFE